MENIESLIKKLYIKNSAAGSKFSSFFVNNKIKRPEPKIIDRWTTVDGKLNAGPARRFECIFELMGSIILSEGSTKDIVEWKTRSLIIIEEISIRRNSRIIGN